MRFALVLMLVCAPILAGCGEIIAGAQGRTSEYKWERAMRDYSGSAEFRQVAYECKRQNTYGPGVTDYRMALDCLRVKGWIQ
jgi:hypothetical protein